MAAKKIPFQINDLTQSLTPRQLEHIKDIHLGAATSGNQTGLEGVMDYLEGVVKVEHGKIYAEINEAGSGAWFHDLTICPALTAFTTGTKLYSQPVTGRYGTVTRGYSEAEDSVEVQWEDGEVEHVTGEEIVDYLGLDRDKPK